MSSREIRRLGRFCLVRVVLMLVLLPTSLEAAPLDGKKLLEPNPVTDWVAARVRDGVIKRLELSGSQLAAIHHVVDVHQDDLLADATAVKDARMLLMEQVRAESLDVEAVERVHAEVAGAELQLWIRTGTILQEMRQILTPEQLQEAETLVEELREGAELRFDDLETKFANGELLGKKWLARAAQASAN